MVEINRALNEIKWQNTKNEFDTKSATVTMKLFYDYESFYTRREYAEYM